MNAESNGGTLVDELTRRGVRMEDPGSVHIGRDVDPGRIAPGTVLHPGCRVTGPSTSIGPDCTLGAEGPVALHNVRLGRGVRIASGSATDAVMLDGASMGPQAQVRAGTLIEEQAGGAHAVGLKQTVLLPFVTLGSLINFCDVLMAGGTSRRHHSEVGSSYIHFNFTPHQDKATPSLIGDVPRGVMLDQPPIFLGGQGGLVGPRRIAFGTVIAAGCICREDVTECGQLVVPAQPQARSRSYDPARFGELGPRIAANYGFIGNLLALRVWYARVRAVFTAGAEYAEACRVGALELLDGAFEERVKRLRQLAAKVGAAPRDRHQRAFAEGWASREDALRAFRSGLEQMPEPGGALGEVLDAADRETPYIEAVRGWPEAARSAGTEWLDGIVASVMDIGTTEDRNHG
ncbi:hypothetical protein [Kiritimatiella glycovorans]|uniref:Bifunctional protein GlmU n=1 Tax=Kiritimatiella glycovorans TaxID=1307763 RepID=A0A0G3EGR9_9BACT|nr:hypothetical protein [Kiritimatiella glycovorans]AKJ64005.1 Bifunctional protein GlmU [Kiritimatiella glycovorans]